MTENTVALTVENRCYHLIDPKTTEPLAPMGWWEFSATARRACAPAPSSTMPPADPMTTGGVDMSGGGRVTDMTVDPTRRIHFD